MILYSINEKKNLVENGLISIPVHQLAHFPHVELELGLLDKK